VANNTGNVKIIMQSEARDCRVKDVENAWGSEGRMHQLNM
jgi:hypothetical protein